MLDLKSGLLVMTVGRRYDHIVLSFFPKREKRKEKKSKRKKKENEK